MNFAFEFSPTKLNYQHQMKIDNSCEVHTLPGNLFTNIPSDSYSAYDAAKLTARNISEMHDGKITLCLSGGLDSQAMLAAFIASGCKFSVSVLKFSQNLNAHDIEFVKDFCDHLNIPYKVVDVDVIRFFESGMYFDIAIQAKTNSPQFALFAWFADQLDSVPVFSGQAWTVCPPKDEFLRSDQLASRNNETDMYIPALKEYAAENYLALKDRKCISHFFSFEEKLLKSFWTNKYILNDTPLDFELHKSYQFKYFSYLHSGFPLVAPSRMLKLNGFERLLQYFSRKFNSSNHYYFNELFRLPLEKLIPKREEIKIIFSE